MFCNQISIKETTHCSRVLGKKHRFYFNNKSVFDLEGHCKIITMFAIKFRSISNIKIF